MQTYNLQNKSVSFQRSWVQYLTNMTLHFQWVHNKIIIRSQWVKQDNYGIQTAHNTTPDSRWQLVQRTWQLSLVMVACVAKVNEFINKLIDLLCFNLIKSTPKHVFVYHETRIALICINDVLPCDLYCKSFCISIKLQFLGNLSVVW